MSSPPKKLTEFLRLCSGTKKARSNKKRRFNLQSLLLSHTYLIWWTLLHKRYLGDCLRYFSENLQANRYCNYCHRDFPWNPRWLQRQLKNLHISLARPQSTVFADSGFPELLFEKSMTSDTIQDGVQGGNFKTFFAYENEILHNLRRRLRSLGVFFLNSVPTGRTRRTHE